MGLVDSPSHYDLRKLKFFIGYFDEDSLGIALLHFLCVILCKENEVELVGGLRQSGSARVEK